MSKLKSSSDSNDQKSSSRGLMARLWSRFREEHGDDFAGRCKFLAEQAVKCFWPLALLLIALIPLSVSFTLIFSSASDLWNTDRKEAVSWRSNIATCRSELQARRTEESKSDANSEKTEEHAVGEDTLVGQPVPKGASDGVKLKQDLGEEAIGELGSKEKKLFLQLGFDLSKSIEKIVVFDLLEAILIYGIAEGDCIRLVAITGEADPVPIGGEEYYVVKRNSRHVFESALRRLLEFRVEKGEQTDLLKALRALKQSHVGSRCWPQGDKDFNTATIIASDFVHDVDGLTPRELRRHIESLVVDQAQHVTDDFDSLKPIEVLNHTVAIELPSAYRGAQEDMAHRQESLMRAILAADGVTVLDKGWRASKSGVEHLFRHLRQPKRIDIKQADLKKCREQEENGDICFEMSSNLTDQNIRVQVGFAGETKRELDFNTDEALYFALPRTDRVSRNGTVKLEFSFVDEFYERAFPEPEQLDFEDRPAREVKFSLSNSKKLWYLYPDHRVTVKGYFMNKNPVRVCVFLEQDGSSQVAVAPFLIDASSDWDSRDLQFTLAGDDWEAQAPDAETIQLNFSYYPEEPLIQELSEEALESVATVKGSASISFVRPRTQRTAIHDFLSFFHAEKIYAWTGIVLALAVLFYYLWVRFRIVAAQSLEILVAMLAMAVVCAVAFSVYVPYEYFVAEDLNVPNRINRWAIGLVVAFSLVEVMRLAGVRVVSRLGRSAEIQEAKRDLMESKVPQVLTVAIFLVLELFSLPNFL